MRQQQGFGLIQVAIVIAALAAIAMAATFSMRYERNLFTEGLARLTGKPMAPLIPGPAAGSSATAATAPPAPPAGVLRKCVIDGKTVLSDVDCGPSNPSSEVVRVRPMRGIESPRQSAPEPAESPAATARDKLVEKATR